MSKERLLENLGQVREEYIEEAAPKGLLDNADKATEPVKKTGRITKIYPYLKRSLYEKNKNDVSFCCGLYAYDGRLR